MMVSKLWFTFMKPLLEGFFVSFNQKMILESFSCSKHSYAVGDVSVIMYLTKSRIF